jgi:sec-independent protein translocase protein TatA
LLRLVFASSASYVLGQFSQRAGYAAISEGSAMGGLSLWHWIVVGAVVFLLFGGKFKISDVMGDVAKGIKAFKKGMAEEETPPPASPETPKPLEHQADENVSKTTDANKA